MSKSIVRAIAPVLPPPRWSRNPVVVDCGREPLFISIPSLGSRVFGQSQRDTTVVRVGPAGPYSHLLPRGTWRLAPAGAEDQEGFVGAFAYPVRAGGTRITSEDEVSGHVVRPGAAAAADRLQVSREHLEAVLAAPGQPLPRSTRTVYVADGIRAVTISDYDRDPAVITIQAAVSLVPPGWDD